MTLRPEESKLSQRDLRIRARPPHPRRLSRPVLLASVSVLAAIAATSVVIGLSTANRARIERGAKDAVAAPSPPEGARNLPDGYRRADLRDRNADTTTPDNGAALATGERTASVAAAHGAPPTGGNDGGLRLPSYGAHPATEAAATDELQPPRGAIWQARSATGERGAFGRGATGSDDGARASAIFFARDRNGDAAHGAATHDPGAGARGFAGAIRTPTPTPAATVEGGGRREAFLAGQRRDDGVSDAPFVGPRAPHMLMAGTVIPAALVTALSSDTPGRVIAQVTATVYDSVTGADVLVPPGARLIGTYDARTVYGDGRLLLVWNRLVMPNGWSIALSGMEATDPTGEAGLADRVDNHAGRLLAAIGLSGVVSVVATNAEGDRSAGANGVPSVGDAAAQDAARVGGRIVDRALDVRPTLRVRSGAPVRVLVTQDLTLSPYRR